MFCSECGNQASDGAKFCQQCGAALVESHLVPVPEPVVIKGVTYTPGTGRYSGYYSGPSGWVTIENFLVKRASPDREPASIGRKVAGVAHSAEKTGVGT